MPVSGLSGESIEPFPILGKIFTISSDYNGFDVYISYILK